jgi:hypothetical protein
MFDGHGPPQKRGLQRTSPSCSVQTIRKPWRYNLLKRFPAEISRKIDASWIT